MTACDYLDRGTTAADPAAALADPHVVTCAICRGAAASMAWITEAVPRLADDGEPPAGWEARVLAAIAQAPSPPRRAAWRVAAPAVAMAAALVAYLAVRGAGGPPALALAIAVDPGPTAMRGDASIGDVVHIAGTGGGRHRALWIYREGHGVELSCPRAPDPGLRAVDQVTPAARVLHECASAGERVAVTFSPRVAARYDVVLLASPHPIPPPTDSLDESVAAARGAGAEYRVSHLLVR